MPAAFPVRWPGFIRLETANQRLAVAFAISLLLHGLGYATWKTVPIARAAFKSAILKVAPRQFAQLERKPTPPTPPPPRREVPMIFVEVDPALATVDPPQDTKNYSTHNSLAANPQPQQREVPKIDGTQKNVLRTTDNPMPSPQPLQPAPPPELREAAAPEPKVAEAKPEPMPEPLKPEPPRVEAPKTQPPQQEVGDLAAATRPTAAPLRPTAQPDAAPGAPPTRERPRTVREAMLRNPALAGNKTEQEGGVPRRGHIALDAKGSVFGNYDSIFIGIVQQRWYSLLDDNRFGLDRRGKVTLTFRLHYDGRISEVNVEENTVGPVLGLICQKAILDPAPFPKWPTDMRQQVGKDIRDVRFTFFYD